MVMRRFRLEQRGRQAERTVKALEMGQWKNKGHRYEPSDRSLRSGLPGLTTRRKVRYERNKWHRYCFKAVALSRSFRSATPRAHRNVRPGHAAIDRCKLKDMNAHTQS